MRLALASCLALAGCTSTPIEVRDSGVFQPGTRMQDIVDFIQNNVRPD